MILNGRIITNSELGRVWKKSKQVSSMSEQTENPYENPLARL
jgi:hypothetical protein